MSMPGWYPDPGGAKGRFRFWDGHNWSSDTSSVPTGDAPHTGPHDGPARKSDKGWIIALAILLAVTLVAVVVFIVVGTRSPFSGPMATPDNNSSTPTVPEWNETSTPTPSPSASNSGGSLVACPDTLATGNTPQIAGKLTADTLQVNQINGWGSEDMALNFTYDGHWQNKVIAQSFLSVWESNIGVALLSNADGFTDPQTSAEQIMECFASSGYYINFTGRTNQVNQAMTVAGHPAWRIESQIHVNDPDFPQVQGDVADVIVVNLGGSKDHLGLFLSCYTIGDAATQQQVLNAMSTLTVTG